MKNRTGQPTTEFVGCLRIKVRRKSAGKVFGNEAEAGFLYEEGI